jgi:hypothetical protein
VKAGLFRTLKGANVAITSKGRNDGVGAQALAKITTQVMAKSLEMHYVHLPFAHLEHVDAGMKPSNYAEQWEKLLCIGGDHPSLQRYPHIRNLAHQDLDRRLETHPFKAGWAYVVRDAHSFTEAFGSSLNDEWRTIIKELRLRYRGIPGESFRRASTSGVMTVAIHIRRGDAAMRGAAEKKKRTLENTYYVAVMHHLQRAATQAGVSLSFHIVSEGIQSEFEEITGQFKNVELHLSTPSPNVNHRRAAARSSKPARVPRNQHLLNRRRNGAAQAKMQRVQKLRAYRQGRSLPGEGLSTADAFKLLVGADVLVMSKSSFSYLAALYSQSIKMFPPEMWWDIPGGPGGWCEQEDGWLRVLNGGIVANAPRLVEELRKRSATR